MGSQSQIFGNTRHLDHPEQSPVKKRKALIMDDNPTLLLALVVMLQTCGYSADWARNGEEAIEKYRQAKEMNAPFDIVLLDLHVPLGKGGKETIENLRAIDSNVRAIVSSDDSYNPVVVDFKEYGFCAALHKPFTLSQLIRTLSGLEN